MPHFKIPQARVYILDLSAHQDTFDHLCELAQELGCDPNEIFEFLLSYLYDNDMTRERIEEAVMEITNALARDASMMGQQVTETPVYFNEIVRMGQSIHESVRAAGMYQIPDTPPLVCLPFTSLRRVVLMPHNEL